MYFLGSAFFIFSLSLDVLVIYKRNVGKTLEFNIFATVQNKVEHKLEDDNKRSGGVIMSSFVLF